MVKEDTLILGALGIGALYFLSKDGVFKGISDTTAGLGSGVQGLGEGVAEVATGLSGGISDIVGDTTSITGAISQELVDLIKISGGLSQDVLTFPKDFSGSVTALLGDYTTQIKDYISQKQKDTEKDQSFVKTQSTVILAGQTTPTKDIVHTLNSLLDAEVAKQTTKQKTEARKADIVLGDWRSSPDSRFSWETTADFEKRIST